MFDFFVKWTMAITDKDSNKKGLAAIAAVSILISLFLVGLYLWFILAIVKTSGFLVGVFFVWFLMFLSGLVRATAVPYLSTNLKDKAEPYITKWTKKPPVVTPPGYDFPKVEVSIPEVEAPSPTRKYKR
jgi:hypothetical protein